MYKLRGRRLIAGRAIRHHPCFVFFLSLFFLQAQVDDDVLEDQRVPLEAGGEDKIPAVGGHHGEGARRLDVSLLEALKHLLLAVPQVHL